MTDLTNAERADKAWYAMRAYVARNTESYAHEDPETHLGDLLCDLMHWADEQGVDFNQMVKRGAMHYECETDEENFGGEDPYLDTGPDYAGDK